VSFNTGVMRENLGNAINATGCDGIVYCELKPGRIILICMLQLCWKQPRECRHL